ncbi:hypothetical protein KIW84_013525 [Lathyrus oleraceus]|nr:hypothetical protein KIW84_013525 [Pisum sativum]
MEFDKKKEDKVMKNSSPSSKNCKKKLDPMNKGKEIEDNDDSIRKLDQEFIVFSFREDGTFDVAVESNSPKSESFTSVDGKHVNSNPMIRKQLDYAEGAENVRNKHKEKNISNSNHHDTHTDEHDQVCIDTLKQGVAKESINLSPTQERKNIIRSKREEIEDGRLVTNGSRNSNQSEGSRGSFAFPKLAWDLVESPVKMPKSENLHQKKQKIRCVGFQCFRFK